MEADNVVSINLHGVRNYATIPRGQEEMAEMLIEAGRHAAKCKSCEQYFLKCFEKIIEHSKERFT